jgi:hypothetical protein
MMLLRPGRKVAGEAGAQLGALGPAVIRKEAGAHQHRRGWRAQRHCPCLRRRRRRGGGGGAS